MQKFPLSLSLPTFVGLSISLCTCLQHASGAELKGNVETLAAPTSNSVHSAKASKSGTMLQGGIKDDAALRSSLKLLPAKPDKLPFPLGGPVQHVNSQSDTDMVRGPGGIMYAPGLGVPTSVQSTTYSSGHTTPISTYTLMPQNSRVWVAPGFEMSTTPASKSSSSYPSLYDSTAPVSIKGITSYGAGYDLPAVTRHEVPIMVQSTGTGITVLESGYEVGKLSAASSAVAFSSSEATPGSIKGITSWIPGSQLSKSTPGNGIICWSPGYEVSVQSADVSKETIGGVWSTSTPSIPALRAIANPLQNIRQYVEAVQGPPPMMATPLLLPGLKPIISSSVSTWDQWYHRVAKSVYGRWQTEAVGPGTATIRLNVTKYREIKCQVVNFVPAIGAEHTAETEKAFREAALKSVNDVSMFEVPAFPSAPAKQDVTFDIQMKRTVDGPAGFDVSAVR